MTNYFDIILLIGRITATNVVVATFTMSYVGVVWLFVRSHYLINHTFKFHKIFCRPTCYPWPQCSRSMLCTSGFVDDVMFSQSSEWARIKDDHHVMMWRHRGRSLPSAVSNCILLWSSSPVGLFIGWLYGAILRLGPAWATRYTDEGEIWRGAGVNSVDSSIPNFTVSAWEHEL